jgi:hypothetical protein
MTREDRDHWMLALVIACWMGIKIWALLYFLVWRDAA